MAAGMRIRSRWSRLRFFTTERTACLVPQSHDSESRNHLIIHIMFTKRLITGPQRVDLIVRCKTCRPQEWTDPERYKPLVDPKQREEQVTRYSLEKWMKVKYHTLDPREKKVHSIGVNDVLRSDPDEARIISMEKFQSFQSSISRRGSVREQQAYKPRKDYEEVIKTIASRVLSTSQEPSESWKNVSFHSQVLKFKFLQQCAIELQHEVPNADLHEMKCVNDVVEFYSRPVEGATPYHRLLKHQEKGELPPNLMMLGDPEPFNPESTFMKGIDALPGIYFHPEGVRYRRKYPQLKKKIFWPDI